MLTARFLVTALDFDHSFVLLPKTDVNADVDLSVVLTLDCALRVMFLHWSCLSSLHILHHV